MKKILLIIALCLFSFNVFGLPIDNVDAFFNECKEADDKDNFQISAYCYGFIVASTHYINEFRLNKKLISNNCLPTPKEMMDRFRILYQRNQFEIGSSVDDALYWTHVSLCPTNPEGIYKPKNSPKSQD